MKIYPKKLHSISELEREKKALKDAQKQVSLDNLFSLNGILGGASTSSKNKTDNNSGAVNQNLGIAGLVLDLVLKYALPGSRRNAEKKAAAQEKPSRNIVKFAAKEFIGGYVKWKAIELSLKGISTLIRKSRKKENA